MNRKIRFEDDNQKPCPSDEVTDKDNVKKRKNQRKFAHEEPSAKEKAKTNAVTNEQAGKAFTPLEDTSVVRNTVNNRIGLANIAGFQHGAADLLRNIAPEETPDRNVAASATKFALEAGATTLSKMTVNQNPKKKSTLTNKKSELQLEPDNSNDENNVETPNLKAEQTPAPVSAVDEVADGMDNKIGGEAIAADNNQDNDNADIIADPEVYTDSIEETISGSDSKDKQTSDDSAINTVVDTNTDAVSDVDARTNDINDTVINGNTVDNASSGSASGKPNSKLIFTKDEKAVTTLEKKSDKISEKLEKAKNKLPTKKVKKKQLVFDEAKGKTVSVLTHEKEKIPIGEAKWNKPKDVSMAAKAVGAVTSVTVTKVHSKIHQVEHENVGVKTAHKAELVTESGYRGAKRTATTAYRFYKNRPYRRVAKLEQKSIKNRMKLDYKTALRDNPKLKNNPFSRFMQKRAIKRNYAQDLRNAKKAAVTTEKAAGIIAKAGNAVTAVIRKNPVFLIKAGLLVLILFLIMSMLTMCVAMFSGGSTFMGALSYPSETKDINDASILYTEMETDLQLYINDIRSNQPGYDEYRVNADVISHNPFELMAFLSAVYDDFTYSRIVPVLRDLFAEQYQLTLTPTVEIRGSGDDRYYWHILNVRLTSQPLSSVLAGWMDSDQTQHYGVLMYSNGARQIVGNPFDFDWLSNVTSLYGYRIHPISGFKDFHWGIDIGLPTGTPIMSGLTGKVVAVGYDAGGYGNYVVVENEEGIQARYAHCHEVSVTRNQTVELGDVIATVGNTGASTGAHLHIEVSVDGQRVNPIFFVETGNEGKSHVSPGLPGGLAIPEYPGAPMDDARFAAVTEEAMKHLGKPYVWGASGPSSFDCSGFVWYVLNQSGTASFGRTTAQGIFNMTTPITKENLQPGDLVFLTGTYSTTDYVTHIAIYIGNGMVIHAGNPISYASINSSFWVNHYYASGRLP